MRYFDIKKDSLEEVISKAINEDNRPSAKELVDEGGKYLKYSDLLLQKGRLLAKNQNTAMIDKEIKKEMKKLGIKETLNKDDEKDVKDVIKGLDKAVDAHSGQSKELKKALKSEETGDKEKYKEFFQSALKKFGVDSPADFKDDAKKKEFFNYVDKNYKGDHEESVDLEEENIKIIFDNVPDKDFDKFVKTNKLKTRYDFPGASKVAGVNSDEIEVSGDKRAIEKLLKLRNNDSLSNYKLNSRTKTYESNNLEAKLTKNVDETIDRIREANVGKGRTMRNILADIWKMNEGKNVFAKDEAVSSVQQAAIAISKKEKEKKEEDEKGSSKTMTGKKSTKVEVEPELK